MANVSLRVGVLGAALLIATAACGGGFGGSTAAPSAAAPTEAAAPSEPAATAEAPATAAAAEPVTLGYLIGDAVTVQARAKGLTEAYTKLHPNVTFDIQTVPGGAEGDNALKTQLATGTAPDLIWYNSGALLSNINPEKSLVDLTNEPFIANIVETAIPSLSVNGKVYGVPSEDAGAAGILYNKKIYSDLGLSVPKTWAEFAANNEKIKAAGIAPVGASFGDTWTSQFMFLADYCNVQNAVPDFAEQFTAGTAKFETTPAGLAGFSKLEDGFKNGWWQEDFGATKFPDALNMLIDGKIAQYPTASFAIGVIAGINPAALENIGFFGIPGDDAAKNCATFWMPSATYLTATSKNTDAAKDFLAFVASVDGANAEAAALPPSGPFMIKGANLPDTVAPAVKENAAYLTEGKAVPALEFQSPLKGPSLEQITVAVGSGLNSAKEGAALYDQDVEKQAKQLGLPGW